MRVLFLSNVTKHVTCTHLNHLQILRLVKRPGKMVQCRHYPFPDLYWVCKFQHNLPANCRDVCAIALQAQEVHIVLVTTDRSDSSTNSTPYKSHPLVKYYQQQYTH